MSARQPGEGRTIRFEMTWRAAAQIIAAALENGTGAGRDAARAELFRMADLLDQLNAEQKRAAEPEQADQREGSPPMNERDQLALAEHARRALDHGQRLEQCTGEEAIAATLAAICDTRANLARLSGMTPETLRAIERGKRPTAAQRAALSWAVFKRWAR